MICMAASASAVTRRPNSRATWRLATAKFVDTAIALLPYSCALQPVAVGITLDQVTQNEKDV
jgi:hypothetical protein